MGPGEAGALDVPRTLMEVRNMMASDLGRPLGERSVGLKTLSGTRASNKRHLKKLTDSFGVSADLFLE